MSLYKLDQGRLTRMPNATLRAFDTTLAEIVPLKGSNARSPDAIRYRLDFLTRLVEVLRFEHGHYTCELPMKVFITRDIFPDKSRIHVPPAGPSLGELRAFDAIQMQPMLLQYLVTRVDQPETIYDTIEKFIHRIAGDLTVIDFERSLTGVLRCFTNARIAASRLSRYGFIRAAPRDYGRKWVPSLPGLVVAFLLHKHPDTYMKRRGDNLSFWIIHPAIRHIWSQVLEYDAFLSVLRAVCIPHRQQFDTFEPMLRSIHKELTRFFKDLMHGEHQERDEVAAAIKNEDVQQAIGVIRQLEKSDRYEDFVREFGLSLQMLDLLAP
jgi:hypothetical protein